LVSYKPGQKTDSKHVNDGDKEDDRLSEFDNLADHLNDLALENDTNK